MILLARIFMGIGFAGLLLGIAISYIALQKNNDEWVKTGCDTSFRGMILMVAALALTIIAYAIK